jgi:hypothetical protein
MTVVLHHAAVIHVTGVAALTAITTLMPDRLIACSVRIGPAPAEQLWHRRERIVPTGLR